MSLNWCLLTCTAPGGRCVSLSSSLFYLNICDPMKKITCLGWRGQAPVSTQCLYAVITLTWRSGVSSWLSPFLTSGKKRKRKETLKRFCMNTIFSILMKFIFSPHMFPNVAMRWFWRVTWERYQTCPNLKIEWPFYISGGVWCCLKTVVLEILPNMTK